MDNAGPDIIVLKFADSAVPVFKETRGGDYIKYGVDNAYPEYLNLLYNKSAKHNAIITGKANYIFGNGYANGDFIVNRLGESLNDVAKKCILDCRIYGGWRMEIVWGFNKKVAELYHVDYSTIRKAKNGGFIYKESWKAADRCDEKCIPAFNPAKPEGTQIYEYNEYRPGIRFYPLPDYIGANNYIETDIEISKFYLSSIKNGMMPSKMIQFYIGDVPNEKKQEIEDRWKRKFSGSENAGKFVLVFNQNKDKSVDVQDLSGTELDKMFQELNKTTQQEIYSGHNITSPMLFGIAEPGKLGGGNELQTSYSIFQNTYARPKAKDFDREVNNILKLSIFPQAQYELEQSDPIGINFDIKEVTALLPKQFIYEKIGVPKEMWGADVMQPAEQVPGQPALGEMANDNIKNLSAKQHQQLMRIIRQYSKGTLTEPAARTLLKTGLNLNDTDIDSLLGIEKPLQLSFSDDDPIAIFDAFGESKNDYEILKTKAVSFSTDDDAADDEIIVVKDYFKSTYDISLTENRILELIKKDPLITPEVIAGAIGETVAFVERNIANLTENGFLEAGTEMVGADTIIKRTVSLPDDIKIPPVKGKVNPAQIYIKYSYEGPQDSRNRPFCAKLMELNRLYSRLDIEKISQRLGYSVWDRRGGFYNKGNGVISESCRHTWKSNIVVKKGGSNVS